MTSKEEIIKNIESRIKSAEKDIKEFKENENFLHSLEWNLKSAIKSEVEINFLKSSLESLSQSNASDLKRKLIHIRKILLEYLTSGHFSRSSSSKESNLIALYKGEVYGEQLQEFDAYIEWVVDDLEVGE